MDSDIQYVYEHLDNRNRELADMVILHLHLLQGDANFGRSKGFFPIVTPTSPPSIEPKPTHMTDRSEP